MSGLAFFKPITTEVDVSGQTITVRGLSLLDISSILADHGGVAERLYQKHIVGSSAPTFTYDDEGNAIQSGEITEAKDADPFEVIKTLITEAPQLVSAMIAYASDEPDLIEEAGSIPGMDQMKILVEIARLTFKSEEDLGNLVDTLLVGLGSLTSAIGRVSAPMDDEALPEA